MPVNIAMGSGFIKSKRAAKRLEKELRKQLEPVLNKGIRERKKVVQDWSSSSKPAFTSRVKVTPHSLEANILMGYPPAEGSKKELGVYHYVNWGTKVRRARVSFDWESKTIPNTLATREGKGIVTQISTDLSFPGIEARNFEDIINKMIEGEVTKVIIETIQAGTWIKP